MKNCFALLVAFITTFSSMAQHEEIAPMNGNLCISNKKIIKRANSGTFDSTFIYLPDTLSLPFFDDFSSDHFQQYSTDYNDPTVTFVKEYKLIDAITSQPLPNDEKYTTLQTFRRIYNVGENTYVDEPLPSSQVKIGNQTNFPTVYATTTVYPPYYIYDTLDFPNPSDTIWINEPDVYQDSAKQFFMPIVDPDKFWLDNYVYKNDRFAILPWTIGVATFDGLNDNGKAYGLGMTNPDYADVLTSKPINLSNHNAGDSLYLSFLYQKGGLGDQPELGDSLALEFYAEDLDEWRWVWSTNGGYTDTFNFAHIPVLDVEYFKKGFQFRWKNYGSLAGGFDHFHIDYIHLRESSGYQDTLFKDFAFVYPIPSLLKEYTSVPWDHYKNNYPGKMSDQVQVTIRNSSNQPENNSTAGSVEIKYNSSIEGNFALPGVELANNDLNYAPRTFYTSLHDFSSGYHFDETKSGTQQNFDIKGSVQAIFPNYGGNDTTHTTQYFGNYYSYDDGTAEAAYGPTGVQARLAVRYDAYEADSLIGIMTQFVESGNSVANKLFLITVWDDNNGVPGNVLYEDDLFSPRTPKYSDGVNSFYTYYFKDTMKVHVDQTFYIGWKQYDADRLNIGFDRNLDNSSKNFYSVSNTTNENVIWNPSGIAGSIMIRPIFSTELDAELSLEEKTELTTSHTLILYPNPTNGLVYLRTDNPSYQGVEIYNMQGQMVAESMELSIDLSEMPSGMYFLKEKSENTSATYKIVKK